MYSTISTARRDCLRRLAEKKLLELCHSERSEEYHSGNRRHLRDSSSLRSGPSAAPRKICDEPFRKLLRLFSRDARTDALAARVDLSADRELALREFLVTHLLIRPRQRVVSFHIVRLQYQSAPQLGLRRCELLLCEQRASHAVMRLEPFRLQADSLAIEIFRRFKLPPLKFNVARQPVGIVEVRVDFDLLLELVQGRLLIPLALVRVSQMVMGERKLGRECEGLFELLEGGNGAI